MRDRGLPLPVCCRYPDIYMISLRPFGVWVVMGLLTAGLISGCGAQKQEAPKEVKKPVKQVKKPKPAHDAPEPPPDPSRQQELLAETTGGYRIWLRYWYPAKAHENGRGWPVAVLLHGLGSSSYEWREPTIKHFLKEGFIVVAPDLPGHGKSAGYFNTEKGWRQYEAGEWRQAPVLTAEAVSMLKRQTSEGIPIDWSRTVWIGSGFGANIAVFAKDGWAAKTGGLHAQAMVLVMPAVTLKGLALPLAIPSNKVPTYLVAPADNAVPREAAKQLYSILTTTRRLDIVKAPEEGAELLNNHEDLRERVIAWVKSPGATAKAAATAITPENH